MGKIVHLLTAEDAAKGGRTTQARRREKRAERAGVVSRTEERLATILGIEAEARRYLAEAAEGERSALDAARLVQSLERLFNMHIEAGKVARDGRGERSAAEHFNCAVCNHRKEPYRCYHCEPYEEEDEE